MPMSSSLEDLKQLSMSLVSGDSMPYTHSLLVMMSIKQLPALMMSLVMDLSSAKELELLS